MDKERLKQLAGNKEFISGIYNYCDRWCEKCPFTSRCMNFAVSNEDCPDSKSCDIENATFWQKMNETLQAALDLLREAAEERGVDLDVGDQGDGEKERLKDEPVRHSKWCRAAMAYAEMTKEWFKSHSYLFEQDRTEEFSGMLVHCDGHIRLRDAMEVVRWYQSFIYVKLTRAIRGSNDPEPEIGYAKDSDGSAKLALIAIDRSIAAWTELLRVFPAHNTASFNPVRRLDEIRQGIEELFPDARAFISPGFDKIDLNS